jgi:hypothetical protein
VQVYAATVPSGQNAQQSTREEDMKTTIMHAVVLAAVTLSLGMASQAWATPIADQIDLTCQAGSSTVNYVFTAPLVTGQSPVVLTDASGNPIATIKELTWDSDTDPSVNLHFSVQAGATDTTITFNSTVVSFAPLTNPTAVATSSLTLTDADGDGATITGLQSGNKCYSAIYNGNVTWTSLNQGYTFSTPFDGQTETDRLPASGFQTISDTVSSIQSQYSFVLSANDEASGTSTFNVTPEPATLSLMAIGGLAMLRRRK